VTFRPEDEVAAVVCLEMLGDAEHAAGAAPQGDRRRVHGPPELEHLEIVVVVGEGDVEAARALIVGREGDREQALLDARVLHPPADVEEGPPQLAAPMQHPHDAGLLDHEQQPPGAWGLGEVGRLAQTGDADEAEGTRLRRGAFAGAARDRADGRRAGGDGDEREQHPLPDEFDPRH
jgi:hypothetical protein